MANTTVNLYSKELDEDRAHELEHANRLFKKFPENSGWVLKDKDFTQNKDGIIVRKRQSESSETEQSGPA
jgi:hypothetical protein